MSKPLTNAETAHKEQQRKKQRTRFGCCLMGCLPPVELIVFAVVLFFSWRWQVQQDIETLTDEIRSRGEPLTIQDMQERYALAADEIDKTPQLQKVFRVFESKAFEASAMGLPLVGHGEDPPENLCDPWPEHDEVRVFLKEHANLIEAIETAALAPGVFRFPIKIEQHYDANRDHLQRVLLALRILKLKALSAVVDGEDENAFRAISSMFEIAKSLEQHPLLIGQFHFESNSVFISETICQTLPQANWNDGQLQLLTDECLRIDWHAQMSKALIDARAMAHIAFNDAELKSESQQSVLLANDHRLYLQLINEAIEASRLKFPKLLPVSYRLFDKFKAALESRFRTEVMWDVCIMSIYSIVLTYSEAQVQCEGTAAQIAVNRYRMKYGKRPESLADLVPEFLPSLPTDPYDGQPLRYRANNAETLIYSVGQDRKDDDGYESLTDDPFPDVVTHVNE